MQTLYNSRSKLYVNSWYFSLKLILLLIYHYWFKNVIIFFIKGNVNLVFSQSDKNELKTES